MKTFLGMRFSQRHVVPEMRSWDLIARVSHVDVPVHLFQGRLAHMPHLEEPERFFAELCSRVGYGAEWRP